MWRFKKEFKDAEIVISGMNLVITERNLTDERAEMIVKKFPQFAHNLENVNPEFKNDITDGEELTPNAEEVNKLTGKPADFLAGINVTESSTQSELLQAEKAEAANNGDAEVVAEIDEDLAELERLDAEDDEKPTKATTKKKK